MCVLSRVDVDHPDLVDPVGRRGRSFLIFRAQRAVLVLAVLARFLPVKRVMGEDGAVGGVGHAQARLGKRVRVHVLVWFDIPPLQDGAGRRRAGHALSGKCGAGWHGARVVGEPRW